MHEIRSSILSGDVKPDPVARKGRKGGDGASAHERWIVFDVDAEPT